MVDVSCSCMTDMQARMLALKGSWPWMARSDQGFPLNMEGIRDMKRSRIGLGDGDSNQFCCVAQQGETSGQTSSLHCRRRIMLQGRISDKCRRSNIQTLPAKMQCTHTLESNTGSCKACRKFRIVSYAASGISLHVDGASGFNSSVLPKCFAVSAAVLGLTLLALGWTRSPSVSSHLS